MTMMKTKRVLTYLVRQELFHEIIEAWMNRTEAHIYIKLVYLEILILHSYIFLT